MSSPKPGPRVNLLHQIILGSLLSDHLLPLKEPRIARNVSAVNVDIMAARWIP